MRWDRRRIGFPAAFAVLVIASGVAGAEARAQDIAPKCRPVSDEQTGSGGLAAEERSRFFPEIQSLALEINFETCLALIGGDLDALHAAQSGRFLEFGSAARALAEQALTDPPFEGVASVFDHFVEVISVGDLRSKSLPELRVELPNQGDQTIFHFDDIGFAGQVRADSQSVCANDPRFGVECAEVLDDLALAINDYKFSYEEITADRVVSQLGVLSGQWDDFLENGRSQTFLDLIATSFFERRHFRRDYLVGPPRRQWSAFHPDLVYEHASDAPSGEKDKLTVGIEWIGVNWWSENSPLFRIPFGISLVSVYSDRPGLDSVGHGVAFHFDNKYTIGWTDRSGDRGVFVSLDFLAYLDRKSERLDKFKTQLSKEYLETVLPGVD